LSAFVPGQPGCRRRRSERFASRCGAQNRRPGISLLIAESNLVNAARIADRLYAIDRGEIIFEGKPEQALEDANVMKALRG
jgi:ABC-type branched-subunit amino acid transport system ATPase component